MLFNVESAKNFKGRVNVTLQYNDSRRNHVTNNEDDELVLVDKADGVVSVYLSGSPFYTNRPQALIEFDERLLLEIADSIRNEKWVIESERFARLQEQIKANQKRFTEEK